MLLQPITESDQSAEGKAIYGVKRRPTRLVDLVVRCYLIPQ